MVHGDGAGFWLEIMTLKTSVKIGKLSKFWK